MSISHAPAPINAAFARELARYGPTSTQQRELSFAESSDYCRRLAQSHYENFTVASWLLPRELRPHFCHVYAYCRWADDLADETLDRQLSLELLAWWEGQLADMVRGRARHPVFVALAETVREFGIPKNPLADLLTAFRQDQVVTRYETFDQVLGYCQNSANPVGRLVLYLGRSHDEDRGQLADSICTGLQLANFCQDVARDWERGRLYLCRESLVQFGCSETQFPLRQATPEFRRLLAHEVDRAEDWLRKGLPLVERLPRALAADVWLFVQGGLAILAEIRRLNYGVWAMRPTVSSWRKAQLLTQCLWLRTTGRLRQQASVAVDAEKVASP